MVTGPARRAPDLASHRRDAEVEDVRFLVSTGLSLEQACDRVGVKPACVEQRLARHTKEPNA